MHLPLASKELSRIMSRTCIKKSQLLESIPLSLLSSDLSIEQRSVLCVLAILSCLLFGDTNSFTGVFQV